MALPSDAFALAAGAQQLVDALVGSCDEFIHLRRHTIGVLYSRLTILDRGGLVTALMSTPVQVTAKVHERQLLAWTYAQLFRERLAGAVPDFVIYLHRDSWLQLPELEQERALFHELLHLQQRRNRYNAPQFERNGRPALHIARHDVELFQAELVRYNDQAGAVLAAAAAARRPPRRLHVA